MKCFVSYLLGKLYVLAEKNRTKLATAPKLFQLFLASQTLPFLSKDEWISWLDILGSYVLDLYKSY